jgi:hypothetical protein
MTKGSSTFPRKAVITDRMITEEVYLFSVKYFMEKRVQTVKACPGMDCFDGYVCRHTCGGDHRWIYMCVMSLSCIPSITTGYVSGLKYCS